MTVLRKMLFWGAAVVFPLPLLFTYDAVALVPQQLKLYIFLGLIAYAWWLLAVLLSVRPVWLERLIGLPSIYGLHGMLGVLALATAYLHQEYSYAPSSGARLLGDWAFYGALAVLCYSAFFISGWLVDRSRLLLRAKGLLEKVFRHRLSVWIHRLNLLVIVMIFLHAHLLVRVNQYLGFMLLFDAYTVLTFTVYAWRKWISPDAFLAGVVVGNEPLGTSARRISIRLDERCDAVRPGDFLFLSFEAVSREWHPFSVTDNGQNILTFTVRTHGDFTSRLDGVTTGTRVRLEGPFGRFDSIAQGQPPERPLVLVGMGAGVAPLLSLVSEHHTTRQIRLLWSVRTPEDAYYRSLLDEYEAASGGQLTTEIKTGRFRREDLTRALSTEEIKQGTFFVVGPGPGVLGQRRLLRRLGVSPLRLHDERLTM
ncbi:MULTISPECIES: FAD-binding oxidoreductase [unclassified Streptomyces]|uniref:FAD-binding oxidoreductase n=1 Tax=unclassified Streptomyces TaxID=2593676 RepID=UPI001E34FB2A|nr:FAD-binding oxidoreductase [Streptomyces sp. CB02980]MCB8902056.1 ferric reductase [Streptomyces sp. CB02980]